jgi:2-polyprenyl-6-hydroxyphenyl methylase/3-demethylubiquinone-9 3-methyltransferase
MDGLFCKCCGGVARPAFQHDFSRSCAGEVFPASGEPVVYDRCERCGFVFTTHFDDLLPAQMARKIYNEDYIRADPDFAGARPAYFAELLTKLPKQVRAEMSVLDFGGGSGLLARLLAARGFARTETYDPYFGETTPQSQCYDLVSAFEVAEHAVDPLATFKSALAFAHRDGALLFSTLLQPGKLDPDWWYIAPRNGHVSIYTERSLTALAGRLGFHVVMLTNGLHVMYRGGHSRVARLLMSSLGHDALREASFRGSHALLRASWASVRLGFASRALNPRHAARYAALTLGLKPPPPRY